MTQTTPAPATPPTLGLQQLYYSPVEVAFMLSLNVHTIRGYIRDRKLIASKYNGMWRIHRDSLQSFINENFGAST